MTYKEVIQEVIDALRDWSCYAIEDKKVLNLDDEIEEQTNDQNKNRVDRK